MPVLCPLFVPTSFIPDLSRTSPPHTLPSSRCSVLGCVQMTRWVNTKEEHCSKIMSLISEYCMAQRVKPFGTAGSPFASEQDYMDALKAHHLVMVAAMKSKQTVDVAKCDDLDHAVDDFSKMYLPDLDPQPPQSPAEHDLSRL